MSNVRAMDRRTGFPLAPPVDERPLAGAGYFDAANAEACGKAGIEPPIAMGRRPRHPLLTERDLDGAARSRDSATGRSHGASDEDAGRQGSLLPCANNLPSRFPASSKRCPDSVSFRSAGSPRRAAGGASRPWPGM
ncbi:MAG: hypothetical protein WBF43_01845 [Methylocella sp.]